MKIAIVGLGYVGLPLSLQFARSGVNVLGLDIDSAKVDAVNNGESYIKHIPAASVAELVKAGTFSASTDFRRVSEVEAVIICVPTPLNKNREPDISYIVNTGKAIAPHLRKGTLVVLESTTYPGTTDEDLRGVLEGGSGMIAGVDFHLAFSPEREDPGNPDSKVAIIPKVVGGCTPQCTALACALYGAVIDSIVPVSSTRVAEMVKLLENTFRAVNIGLVNELALMCDRLNIDVWEVINAAATKPAATPAASPTTTDTASPNANTTSEVSSQSAPGPSWWTTRTGSSARHQVSRIIRVIPSTPWFIAARSTRARDGATRPVVTSDISDPSCCPFSHRRRAQGARLQRLREDGSVL